ncbi:MAG: hypothetical protein AB7P97_21830 [Hyphomonadaceae bacterium]
MPIESARSRPGLRNLFDACDEDVKSFFAEFRSLVDSGFSLNLVLAYAFFRLEQGQIQALYCGTRKLHKTDADLTWTALDTQHITRDAFRKYFETIFGLALPRDVIEIIDPAETTRDRLMHGKDIDEAELREAISRVLHYATAMNRFLDDRRVGFRPFTGDLRGFVGRLESLDKATSRWILKGMGFNIS